MKKTKKKPTRELEFVRLLICSTAHVPPSMEKPKSMGYVFAEANNPDHQAIIDLSTAAGSYGWLVHVDRGLGFFEVNKHHVPKRDRDAFKKLLLFAQREGFAYILFDRDAHPIEGFKKYRR